MPEYSTVLGVRKSEMSYNYEVFIQFDTPRQIMSLGMYIKENYQH